jgi:hypothetical protein
MEGSFQGVSAEFIKRFAAKHKLDGLTNADVRKTIIEPETKDRCCAYSDSQLLDKSDIGCATVYVLHSGYKQNINRAFNAMIKYAEKHPYTYFWFDLFTINQHQDKPADWWCKKLPSIIQSMDTVLLVMNLQNPSFILHNAK